MKSAFLPSKGLLCLYDKQNNTWLLVDMEFLFSCSTRHLTRSLRSLVSYRVKHSKRNSISTRAHVLFSIYNPCRKISYMIIERAFFVVDAKFFSEITLSFCLRKLWASTVTRIIYYNCSYYDHCTPRKLNLALRQHFVQQVSLVNLLTFVIRNQWIRVNIFYIIHWLSLFQFLSCSNPRWKMWLQLCLYSSANINRCQVLSITGMTNWRGNLMWTTIPSRRNDDTPRHFMLETPGWAMAAWGNELVKS